MSTGLECEIIEVKPGEWYYLLELWSSPKGAWDWREYAEAYGPFPTEDAAEEHLSACHANPGGHSTYEYEEGFKPDKVLAELIADAPKNMQRYRFVQIPRY